jgi:hypothetical protein
MTPADLYRTCRVSACRLEAQQSYARRGGDERQRAFDAGEPLLPPRQAKLDDLRLVSELRQAGRKVGRVHIVDRPLTPYLRYELAVYAENVAAGEDVRIADRSLHPELAALTTDFVIFDAETEQPAVIVFDYDSEGLILGYRHTDDAATADRCREQYGLALSWSVSLSDFTAASRPGGG